MAFGAAVSTAADTGVRITFVDRFQRDDLSPVVTAIGVRGAATPREAETTQILVLFDTSASQAGEYRRHASAALDALVAKCRPADRLSLAACDIACVPLSKRFDAPTGDDLKAARLALEGRTPLGSTDIVAVLDEAATFFAPGSAQRTIVYIGDGPGLSGLDGGEYRRMLDGLRGRRITFAALGIGPDVNWPCLAAIANATGGVVMSTDATTSPGDIGARMAALAVAPVVWPEDTMLSTTAADARLKLLPEQVPPLRGDRDSVLLVVGPLAGPRLEFVFETAGDTGLVQRQAMLTVPEGINRPDNAYLEELARNAFDTGGVFLPTVGREGLELARGVIRSEATTLATLSRQAEVSGAHGSAMRLAFAALRRDPDNAEASVVFTAAQRSIEAGLRLAQAERSDDDPFGGDDPPPAPRPGDAPPRPDPLLIEEPADGLRGRALVEPEERPLPEPLPPAAPTPLTSGERGDWAADPLPTRDPAVAGEDLAELARMRRVRAQRLEQETAVRLRSARQTCAIDPDRARVDLKDLQRLVLSSDDLDPAVRDRLNRQIEIGIRDAIVRGRSKMEHDLAADRNRAIGMERARLDGELRRREERFKQLTERYHALVEEGIRVGFQQPTDAFTEAERIVGKEMAEQAPWLYANRGMPMPAREVAVTAPLVARILDYHAENTRVRRDMERGFMDALHLADVAAIPFPDEPPVIYPSAARWQEITRLREKYKSVDLANPGSAEEKIYDALDKPVESLEFTDTPLRDVISQLQDSQGIPIQIDTKALDEAGFDLDAPVTRNLSGVSLRSALRLILGDLDMTYLVKDEVLLITTKEKAAESLIVKVYPVGDLVMPLNATGVNPFAGGGGMGGMGGMGGGMGGMGGMGGGMGGMGGGMFQISDAKSRIGLREKKPDAPVRPGQAKDQTDADSGAETDAAADSVGLPARIIEADDVTAAVAAYLKDGNRTDLPGRLARLRVSAAELGRKGRFDRAADLIAAAIAAGHPEPWMYEALAVALEAAGKPASDVERALLSSADFARSAGDLLALANYLARYGSNRQALRLCRRVTRIDQGNREAFALAMALAAKEKDDESLRWACAGVLAHEWPAAQKEVPTRAARLAKAAIERQRKAGLGAEADAFAADVDAALVRDIELEFSWNGDADVDMVVEEPSGTVCSVSSPRSTSGGTLLADLDTGGDDDNGTHRERYVAAAAFPGRYHVLVRKAFGKLAADTVTAELVLHRGTDREQRLRRQIPLGAADVVFSIDVPEGRRREPLLEAQIAQDVAVQQEIGRSILAQQLAGISDPATAGSLSQGRTPPAAGGDSPSVLPFSRGGATGYQPVISTLPEGTNLSATAVVSADRRYVRVSVTPLFSGVGQVTTFNFAGGGAMGTGGMGGGGMGGMGGGGMGGMGGGGMGGMGGGGMGGMGGGGMGGMGGGGMGGGMGGMGGGMGGFCWVAREVYGSHDPRWLQFRQWLQSDAPTWLHDLYGREGRSFAAWIADKPAIKRWLRVAMDAVIASRPSEGRP